MMYHFLKLLAPWKERATDYVVALNSIHAKPSLFERIVVYLDDELLLNFNVFWKIIGSIYSSEMLAVLQCRTLMLFVYFIMCSRLSYSIIKLPRKFDILFEIVKCYI